MRRESERSTQNGRAKTGVVVVVVVVVVRTPTPNYLRQASQNLGKYTRYMYNDDPLRQPGPHTRSYTKV